MMDLIDNTRTFFTRLFCQHKVWVKRAKIVPYDNENCDRHYYYCAKCGKPRKLLIIRGRKI